MQLDSGLLIAVITGAISTIISIGIYKNGLSRAEREIEKLWKRFDLHVTLQLFESVMQSHNREQAEIKKDIKQIIQMLNSRSGDDT